MPCPDVRRDVLPGTPVSPGRRPDQHAVPVNVVDREPIDLQPAQVRTLPAEPGNPVHPEPPRSSLVNTLSRLSSPSRCSTGVNSVAALRGAALRSAVHNRRPKRSGLHPFSPGCVGVALAEVLQHPGIAARQQRLTGLRYRVVARSWRTCGGGLYAHRYRSGLGFANPSVYCADLM